MPSNRASFVHSKRGSKFAVFSAIERRANLVDEQVVAEGVQSPRPLDGRPDVLHGLVDAAVAVDVVVVVDVPIDPRPVVQVNVAVAVLVVSATDVGRGGRTDVKNVQVIC